MRHVYESGEDYVNENILPVCDETIKPQYVVQVVISALLNGIAWWANKIQDSRVTDEISFREVEGYIALAMTLLPYLPVDPNMPNSRSEVIQELAELITLVDDLHHINELANPASIGDE